LRQLNCLLAALLMAAAPFVWSLAPTAASADTVSLDDADEVEVLQDPASDAAVADVPVDRVVVRKSQRLLLLMKNDSPLRAYPVSLGDEPSGHKQFEGDERTPEGVYLLDWRNPNSQFTKSIHISYPNEADREFAKALGRDPGGMIMIHGRPNSFERKKLNRYMLEDWTDGCIAVSNAAMEEIWELVPLNTPIEIVP
tara:strand:- start:105 stop:695 length:591 start_codon:yes stop_codon:yes gene_type:complete